MLEELIAFAQFLLDYIEGNPENFDRQLKGALKAWLAENKPPEQEPEA